MGGGPTIYIYTYASRYIHFYIYVQTSIHPSSHPSIRTYIHTYWNYPEKGKGPYYGPILLTDSNLSDSLGYRISMDLGFRFNFSVQSSGDFLIGYCTGLILCIKASLKLKVPKSLKWYGLWAQQPSTMSLGRLIAWPLGPKALKRGVVGASVFFMLPTPAGRQIPRSSRAYSGGLMG